MSNRKLSLQGFFHNLGRLYRKITKSFITRVLRYVLFYQRRGKLSTAGFILPTTVLLILVVALTVGALTFRAYNRNVQVIGEAQQRVIYNAATPAIDRARSKLEFLFDATKDTRLPGGIPSQSTLEAMLLNNGTTRKDGETFSVLPYKDAAGNQVDAYTFPDEKRIDINKDGKEDNAWYFRSDTDGNGTIDDKDSTIVYSIILNSPSDPTNPAKSLATTLLELDDTAKANGKWVRQAPLSVDGALGCVTNPGGGNAGPDGWFEDKTSTAILRKNFQVDALVVPGNSGGTKATLEFTQDRQLDRGNKWGAWFRHDLEIYPGVNFRWNGAMHTEGSLIVGDSTVTAYLISSPNSCLYNPPSNSEITVTDVQGGTAKNDLLGLVAAGNVKNGNTTGSASVHLHSSTPGTGSSVATLNNSTASSKAPNPFHITLDPETVLLENGYTNVPIPTSKTDRNNRNEGTNGNLSTANKNLPEFGKQGFPQRIFAQSAPTPYVDDLYRADDLWGPKPKYGRDSSEAVPEGQSGKAIPADKLNLINNDVPSEDTEASGVGLDGYWERRARVRGLRILVGQRLELGNLFTWYTPTKSSSSDNYVGYSGTAAAQLDQNAYEYEGDPLYPPTVKPYPTASATDRTFHSDLQRRTLRDNLSAVQSTAIYHASADAQRDYPIACLATTSHPGTLWTLRQAITFRPSVFSGMDASGALTSASLLTNFFTGVGTNGWEFEPPAGTYDNFVTQVQSTTSSLRKALQNLANFAGDHQEIPGNGLKSGAFPPTPNDTIIHPHPALSMWGNYSNLKRALKNLSDRGNDFNQLSISDKTYIQTAACTLGMLAYNINEIQKFDPSAISGTEVPNDRALGGNRERRLMAKLGRDLWQLMNGRNDGSTSGDPEVLPREQLATYAYNQTGNYDANKGSYNPADYEKVSPEAFIAALRQYLLATGRASDNSRLRPDHPEFIEEMRMAEIIMLNHQIRRDRTFGFKPSRRFGKYAVSPSGVLKPVEMATACDPDQFIFNNRDANRDGDLESDTRNALGLISTPSTVLSSGGLTAANPTDYSTVFPRPVLSTNPTDTVGRSLSQYRLALSRLCGTLAPDPSVPPDPPKPPEQALVLPKFPALYYLFPEVPHDYNGDNIPASPYDHSQPQDEPYTAPYVAGDSTKDNYVGLINAQFEPIDNTRAAGRAGYPSVPFTIPSANATYNELSRKPEANPGNLNESIRVFPVPDLSVRAIALTPRSLDNSSPNKWRLPYLNSPRQYNTTTASNTFRTSASASGTHTDDKANFSTNLILKEDLTPIAVPFLDRAFFDGRQLMLTRTLDIDLGMLRGTRLGWRDETTSVWTPARNDVWLPISGIVYAFREDAVREDGISRPTCAATATTCDMNLQNPASPTDPRVRPINSTRTTLSPGENGISTKSIDPFPDPDRRIYGFRLRNGVQVMRNRAFEGTGGFINAADNNKGLSFFTDQPVYIHGNFNLHQDGNDNTMGTILEEFTDVLDANYTNFYTRRTPSNDFAKSGRDRWRPSEILADSITILSNGFCDGSIIDTFLQYNNTGNALVQAFGTGTYPVPDAGMVNVSSITGAASNRSYYHMPDEGLFDPGCVRSSYTSFHNQNRPANQLETTTGSTVFRWDWVRENSRYDAVANRRANGSGMTDDNTTGHWVDLTAPVKISRSGQPLVVRPSQITAPVSDVRINGLRPPIPPIPYNVLFPTQAYFGYGNNNGGSGASFNDNDRYLANVGALETRVNTIFVSGISPSRPNQGYGGLHNFPRFIENWEKNASDSRISPPTTLHFGGSLIQLSYTNYATSPFELENLEPLRSSDPSPATATNENIMYYRAPTRRWGYDVALQFSPASPAAARFVTAGKNRSEYYVEPPANDPYIANLCEAVKARTELNLNTNCPRRGS
ncbi:hormogonium polysaccharide biosynthesis protein HpsA [Leptolyngbya sp. NIES-2104]|uniref:hormogonium polysaccharide biosynthesis protein HpsA n=1 Tax=Leptolyngbya sp. NIES-2104 TaxID=1552121 RepID=UPI0006EC9A02|nr:hormogonium polysaccharide biosynthesis protein HpsA [Leptolyngbya sp. NIES-2104]GAP96385.1 hypothetical protein NIES2104_29220 [Leptolyngbya sp. NIES-2104]